MAQNKDTLLRWLRDAHAMERATVDNLDRLQDRFSRYPQLSVRMQQHWEESRRQATRLEETLRRLGAEPSALKDVTTRLVGLVEAYAAAIVPDEVLKVCLVAYAFENFEIASYVSLASAAGALGEPDIEKMCNEHLAQERSMVSWLEQYIPEVTREYLRP